MACLPVSPSPPLPHSRAPLPGWLLWLLSLLALFTAACTASDDGPSPGPAAAAKILVSQDGMYELTAADLEVAGLGWGGVDPTQLRLSHRGRQQPLWIQGQGETLVLRFYGQASESRYARDNVYWLQPEQGTVGDGETRRQGDKGTRRQGDQETRGPGDSPSPPLPLTERYTATVRTEENHLYSPRVEQGDHWFWASLPAPQTQTFTVTLTAIAPGPASLQIEVWGSTEGPASPDHHLRVSVNGRRVADKTWDGQGRHTLEAGLPSGLLQEGANVVSIQAPGDTGVAADITFVDWIELRHPRFLVAQADRLLFDSPGGLQRLTGFTGPVSVFDVTDPQAVARVTGLQEQQGQTAVTFQGEPGRRYLAVGPKGFHRPTRIARAGTDPDPSLRSGQALRAPGNGADYVAIGPADLLAPLLPLLQWRETQGLRVMAVPAEIVYDQFNHGLPEPQAIRAFLRYAAQAWQPAPRYLLLVGDATYDPRGYLTPAEANRVPSFLIPTVFGGETASDTAFAQLDDDLAPDIAVGRMPARTPQQVRTLVEKTLAYEQRASNGTWRRRILAVADGQDPSFRADAQAFLDRFSDDYQTELFGPQAGATDASQQVQRQLEAGNLLVAYFGHGSVTQWGKDRIFTTTDIASLGNAERLPVVLNMTCLTGLFTHPKVDSLVETLLWQPEGGAVAALAPTSLTLPTDQSFLSEALVEALLEN
ncbi:MAG: C25 family cysteine peptidase, partial [Anaerolineae bacterium]